MKKELREELRKWRKIGGKEKSYRKRRGGSIKNCATKRKEKRWKSGREKKKETKKESEV